MHALKSLSNVEFLPDQDPGAPNKKPRLPSLKPNFSITEQELCKDIDYSKKFSQN